MWELRFEPEDKQPRFIDGYRVTRQLSVEQVEAENVTFHDGQEIPFEHENPKWHALLAQMQEDDELWLTSSSDEQWDALMGFEGILLVRNGKVIGSLVTKLN